MSENAVAIKIKITFPVILFTVVLLHAFLMLANGLPSFTLASFLPKEKPVTLNIRRVKTAEVKHPYLKPVESVFNVGAEKKKTMTLGDLGTPGAVVSRPGTRPEVLPKQKAMNAISLKSKEFKDFSKSFPSGGIALSDMMTGTQKVSDAVVSIAVPEGIEPDELNEYELMFYGFQKRTAINFSNSILKNIDKFIKTHPNYKLKTTGRITMTARLTYDPQGNVKQIKMIRWTHIDEMQNLFEDIVKNIDQLHNPPKALWEKDNEFAMFYTLEIING